MFQQNVWKMLTDDKIPKHVSNLLFLLAANFVSRDLNNTCLNACGSLRATKFKCDVKINKFISNRVTSFFLDAFWLVESDDVKKIELALLKVRSRLKTAVYTLLKCGPRWLDCIKRLFLLKKLYWNRNSTQIWRKLSYFTWIIFLGHTLW